MISKTFKQIRVNKGFSQARICQGIITPQALSLFECGKTRLNIEDFFKLLEKMNTSIDEFNFYYESNNNLTIKSQALFFSEFNLALANKSAFSIDRLITEEQYYFKTTSNVRHFHNLCLLKLLKEHLSTGEIDSFYLSEIYNYLCKVEEWGYYETCLFTNVLFCIPIKELNSLINYSIRRAKFLACHIPYKDIYISLLSNIIFRLLNINECLLIQPLFNHVYSLLEQSNNIFEYNYVNFLKGLWLITTGNDQTGEKICNDSIDILNHFGKYELAETYINNKEKLTARVKQENNN